MGSTLNLVCTTNPSNVYTDVITPGISDHYTITAEIQLTNQIDPFALALENCTINYHIITYIYSTSYNTSVVPDK